MLEDKFKEFVGIVKRLRKECPWDKEQTHDSIKSNTLEEAYEVVESIDNKDYEELKKELARVLQFSVRVSADFEVEVRSRREARGAHVP